MRIMLVGFVQEPWFPAFEMKAALVAMGHECRYVSASEGATAVAGALAWGPSLAITLQGGGSGPRWALDYVAECQQRRTVTALWAFCPGPPDWLVRRALAHDLVFHTFKATAATLRERGAENCTWLPLAYHDELFQVDGARGRGQKPIRAEVGFVGTANLGERPSYLLRLLEEGFDLKWWGPPLPLTVGTLPTLSWRRRLQAAHAGRTVYGPDFARVAGAADVFLGIQPYPTVEGSWGNRLYWALGCGATYLCRRVPGLEEAFEPGRHLEMFADVKECVERTRALLNKSRLRMRLSVQGRQEVLARHTYQHRFERMREASHRVADFQWQ
jgi:spore maturation protein CgeB